MKCLIVLISMLFVICCSDDSEQSDAAVDAVLSDAAVEMGSDSSEADASEKDLLASDSAASEQSVSVDAEVVE